MWPMTPIDPRAFERIVFFTGADPRHGDRA